MNFAGGRERAGWAEAGGGGRPAGAGEGRRARRNLECGIRSQTAKAEIREVGRLTPLRQSAFEPTKGSGRR